LGTLPAHAYSQLTHEELIDLLWADAIRPLLVQRYPQATEDRLRIAHAYAYGGCLIQDVGYYPFGEPFFSDIAHHVRTGDFVSAMLRDARSLDELAFAIGALSHYVGDSIGHSEAVNPATALTFPELGAKYGPIVTYEESPVGHGRTEFGFDVAQTSWHRYAPRAYRKRIGFRVARQLLYRTFEETYGLHARGILGPARSAVRTYRWAVTSLLPAFLSAQLVRLRADLPVENADEPQIEFLRTISRSEYATTPGLSYAEPGIRAHLLAFVVLIIPKVGRLKVLDTESPSAETEDLFLKSANHAVALLRELLSLLQTHPDHDLLLQNLDLDTGSIIAPGTSKMIEQTFAELATRLVDAHKPIPAGIRDYLLTHYADSAQAMHPNLSPKTKQKLAHAIDVLRTTDP
jgi:Zinc dependent phospholipase C